MSACKLDPDVRSRLLSEYFDHLGRGLEQRFNDSYALKPERFVEWKRAIVRYDPQDAASELDRSNFGRFRERCSDAASPRRRVHEQVFELGMLAI